MHEFSRFYYPIDHPLVTEKTLIQYDEVIGDQVALLFFVDSLDEEALHATRYAESSYNSIGMKYDQINDEDWLEEEKAEWEFQNPDSEMTFEEVFRLDL